MRGLELHEQRRLLRLLLEELLFNALPAPQLGAQLIIALRQLARHQLQGALDQAPVLVRGLVGVVHRFEERFQLGWQRLDTTKETAKLSREELVVGHDSENAVMVMVWLWSSHWVMAPCGQISPYE